MTLKIHENSILSQNNQKSVMTSSPFLDKAYGSWVWLKICNRTINANVQSKAYIIYIDRLRTAVRTSSSSKPSVSSSSLTARLKKKQKSSALSAKVRVSIVIDVSLETFKVCLFMFQNSSDYLLTE